MNWQSFPPTNESDSLAVEALSFDILRALLANRQASSPTVRALSEQTDAVTQANPAAARVRMLAGHSLPTNANEAAGTFFSARNSAETVSGQGERHA